MWEVSPRPVSRGRCRDAAAFCFMQCAESPRRDRLNEDRTHGKENTPTGKSKALSRLV
nr:MAG TPA: hypothetical protein [Caudoviricetes sp.]